MGGAGLRCLYNTECRVLLCKACWDLYDHDHQRVPPIVPPREPSPSSPGASGGSEGETSQARVTCPKGHTLNSLWPHGAGLTCDECDANLGEPGKSFVSCAICDYDICSHCHGLTSPAAERAGRASARDESPPSATEEEPPVAPRNTAKPKPFRRPSAFSKARKEAKQRAQTAKGRAAHQQAKAVRAEKLKKAREQKHSHEGRPKARAKRLRSADAGSCGSTRARRH
jgi:hypothetical protein